MNSWEMISIENKIKEFEKGVLDSIAKLEDKCLIYDKTGQSKIRLVEELQHLRTAIKQLEIVKTSQNMEKVFGHYLTQLTGNTFRMQYFSNNYLSHLENLREDILSVGLNLPKGKVCDFGCGHGFTTISLMSVLNNPQVTGIDNNEIAVEKARGWFDIVKQYIQLFEEYEVQDEDLNQKVYGILKTLKFPEFIKGDVVKQENLPVNIDLAYCRKLLVNIYVGSYEKTFLGEDAIKLAIKNIAKTIKPGGWFLAVEEYNSALDFRRFFDQFDFEEKKIISVNQGMLPMIYYFYQKVS